MTDYTHFDWTLIEVLKEHDKYKSLSYITGHKAVVDAYSHLNPMPLTASGYPMQMSIGRVVANRLQALRRAGKIQHDGKKWEIRR